MYFSKQDIILSRSSHEEDKEYYDVSFFKIRKWELNTFTCIGEYVGTIDYRIFPMNDDMAIYGDCLICGRNC